MFDVSSVFRSAPTRMSCRLPSLNGSFGSVGRMWRERATT
jgi:hypothetical protein